MMLILFSIIGSCSQPSESVFSKDNIVPWCIVPFDARQRSPSERAEMLRDLGFKSLAYDWRDNNIPEFDEEIRQLNKNDIRMAAFWWSGGLPQNEEVLKSSERMKVQLDFFRRNSLNLDVWVSITPEDLHNEPDDVRYTQLARRIDILAGELVKSGCRLGMYNHGGWGGEPENLVEIIKRVKSTNVGIVYNFHHAHEHLEKMPDAFMMMLPYLHCINLNGMNKDSPKILPLGQGTEDVEIIRMISESGYRGPVGIIGHVEDEDVEIVLKRNLEGLRKLLSEIGDNKALESYLK